MNSFNFWGEILITQVMDEVVGRWDVMRAPLDVANSGLLFVELNKHSAVVPSHRGVAFAAYLGSTFVAGLLLLLLVTTIWPELLARTSCANRCPEATGRNHPTFLNSSRSISRGSRYDSL
uniref:(northern house mosquito) hypothetical protein n=1 Tax=Culex pipiens TaxID=7175 RepID=A0A8D8IIH4_CULPI